MVTLPSHNFGFFKVLTDEKLTMEKEEERRRSWSERLFSWPWRPWEKTKTVTVNVPSNEFYIAGGTTIICHPAMLRKVERALEERG